MIHKSGFVNIIGFPNVGKSTLINSLVGEKISIITNRPQTTRHRILGIIEKSNYQIIFSDTPGIILQITSLSLMQKMMMQYVEKSLEDADIVLFMTDIGISTVQLNLFQKCFSVTLNSIQKKNIPVIILINKIDRIGVKYTSDKLFSDTIDFWHKFLPYSEILPISALKKMNQDLLMNKILELLSEHPPYYPKGILSDRTERFFVNEIIREKIFFLYKKEIPYSVEIITEIFKEDEICINIFSSIYVERDSQKGILIGKKGKTIKRLEFFSVREIESFFNKKKVFLKLNVKVCKNWKSNYKKLKNFGY
ncbi:GTPase Era [Blattabacterium cuenoti]|uniref:GTPase Era n=1 Tax=Blattabacterium cuenoti TaxID=1653831 RepID=UPI00163D18BC|nr:GTPase Era [Blattabacterium cuenoti]